jgi:hypothetical protein
MSQLSKLNKNMTFYEIITHFLVNCWSQLYPKRPVQDSERKSCLVDCPVERLTATFEFQAPSQEVRHTHLLFHRMTVDLSMQ